MRVAERCGFSRKRVLRSFEERKGRRYDLAVFSLVPDDLE
jgi:RimJ/RimL family protein N-acetyltransferase